MSNTAAPRSVSPWVDRAALAGLVLACWSPWWHPGPGAGDLPGHLALLWTFQQQLAEPGILPLWTSWWYGGASLVLTYLHPIFSLAALAPFTGLFGAEVGLKVGASVFLALAAVGLHVHCTELGAARRGAMLGALVYALHPSVFVFVGSNGQLHQPVTMAILPWVFVAWRRLGARPTLARAAFAAGVSALLCFDMQRFWIVFPFALGSYALTAWRAPRPDTEGSRPRLHGLAVVVGVGLAMGLLLAFPALPGWLERTELQWHAPESLSLYRERYSFPGAFSLLDRNGWLARVHEPLLGGRFASVPGQWYQGGVAFGFVAVGVWLARSDTNAARRRALGYAIAIWLVALCLSFGPRPVLPGQLALVGELWAGAGGLAEATLLVGIHLALTLWLALAVLAIVRALGSRTPRIGVTAGVAVALGFLLCTAPFVGLARILLVYDQIRAPGHFAFPLLGFALATAAGLVTPAWDQAMRSSARSNALAIAFVALLLVDLWPYREHLSPELDRRGSDELNAAFRELRGAEPGHMLDVHHYNPLADLLTVREARRPTAWGWLGWSSSRYTTDWVMTGIYGSLANASRALGGGDSARARENLDRAADLAGLAHVRFVSSITGLAPPLPRSDAWVARIATPRVTLFDNRRAQPLAQFYPALAIVSGAPREVLPAIVGLAKAGVASHSVTEPDPSAVSREDRQAPKPAFWFGSVAERLAPNDAQPARAALANPPGPAGPLDTCALASRDSAHIRLRCTFPSGGYLVVAQSWSPRWRVRIDAADRPLLRLNHAFAGVAVDAGAAEVDLRYEPSLALRAAQWVSAASWATLLGYGAAIWIRQLARSAGFGRYSR